MKKTFISDIINVNNNLNICSGEWHHICKCTLEFLNMMEMLKKSNIKLDNVNYNKLLFTKIMENISGGILNSNEVIDNIIEFCDDLHVRYNKLPMFFK